MSGLHAEFFVPDDGVVTFPEEFRGSNVLVLKASSPRSPLPKNNEDNDFFRKKSLEEIAAEQGGPIVCADPEKYFGYLSDLWDSEEELEEFLRRRKDEI